jgi:hypothetical protein
LVSKPESEYLEAFTMYLFCGCEIKVGHILIVLFQNQRAPDMRTWGLEANSEIQKAVIYFIYEEDKFSRPQQMPI